MSAADLELQVKVLRGCYEGLAGDQARLKEANVFLEQRVRSLEQRLAEQPAPGASSVVCVPAPAQSGVVAPAKGSEVGGGKETPRDAKEDKAAEAGELEEDDLVEHSLGETIWDAAFFVGLGALTASGSVILLAAMILNAVVQVYICAVLLMSDDFMQRRRYQELQRPMWDFRVNTGHSYERVDAQGRSLMSRICTDDQSLALGFRQADILAEINAYLGLEAGDIVQHSFGTGPLLCGVCIFLFAAFVLRELRSITESSWAVWSVPRARRTMLANGNFTALSCQRRTCILLNNAVRACIAVILLLTGIIWLSSTSSITDLILNAAALSFVMDMDECLFETIVPSSVRMAVGGINSLKYRRSYWNSEAIVPLLGLCAIVVASFPLLVGPNVEDMLVVKKALCDGNVNFMVRKNDVGYMVSMNTRDPDADNPPSLPEKAVRELVLAPQLDNTSSVMQFSHFTKDLSTFRQMGSQTMSSYTSSMSCHDKDVVWGGFLTSQYPTQFTAMRYAAGLHIGMTLLERPFVCADYVAFCQSVAFVRANCPQTCGCDNPYSGLLKPMASADGCAPACMELRRQRIANAPCVDMNVTGNDQWRAYWSTAREVFISGLVGATEHERNSYNAFFDDKISQGCANGKRLPLANESDCDDRGVAYSANGWSSISAFCPSRCCRGPNPPTDCPPSCSASAGSGSR